jgi:hypothetical protein
VQSGLATRWMDVRITRIGPCFRRNLNDNQLSGTIPMMMMMMKGFFKKVPY